MSEQNTTVGFIEEERALIAGMAEASTVSYYSGKTETADEKKALFNATANAEHKLKDEINKPIKLKNVYVEAIEVTNETTGEVSKCPRIILFDDKGKTYSCVSIGIYNTLRRLFATFGTPDTWDKPLTVVPKLISKGADKNILTLEVQ